MDKFQLIDKIIVDLNQLTVTGARNMQIVLATIQNLSVLKDGILREEDARKGENGTQETAET